MPDEIPTSGVIPKKPDDNKEIRMLSIGEIDAKYVKLLKMRGQDEMAEGYGFGKKRFQTDKKDVNPNGDVTTILMADHEVERSAVEESDSNKISVIQQNKDNERHGMQFGRVSRLILEPESPMKKQPAKFKKDSSISGRDGNKGLEKGEIWVTSDVYGTVNHDAYVEHAMKDFLLYIVFLIIANMITFGVLDHAYNYYANVLSEILTNSQFNTSLGMSKTFNEIRSVQQIWDFINGILLKVLYEYGSDHTRSIRLSKKEGVLVLFENILIGVPRIRQQRVKNDSCRTQVLFRDLFSTCYNYYSDMEEDKEPFGMKLATAWTHADPDADSASYVGKISSYGGGGYMMNITRDSKFTKAWINELIEYSWIQQGTRVVFIDFTTYTPNTNLFCVVKLVFELPPTGGVIPTAHFYTMKFLRYVNTWDHIVLGCEIIFLCYIVYFTMEEVQQIMNLKEEYWYSWWNLLDITILIVSYAVVISACVRYVSIASRLKEKIGHIQTNTHASFDNFVHVQRTFNTSAALLSFLVWLKLLKFAALNKSVALILSIFGRVKMELVSLTIMMCTLVIGFALLGNMLFGTHVEQFNTIWNSVFTLVGIFVGGLYFYMECADACPYLAPIFFVLYIFIVLVLFLNAYVALIVHGFHKAVEEFDDQRDRVYLGDICRTLMYKTLRLFRKRALATKLKNKTIAKENKKDYEDIVKILKKHGFRGLDLTILLKKHNVNPGAPVPFDKMTQVYSEIDAKNQLFLEVDEHDKIMDQVDRITKKVESLDKSMADVMTKVDTLVNRLLYAEDAPK